MADSKVKKFGRILIPLFVGAILVAAFVLLYNALREYRYKDLVDRINSYSRTTILWAVVLTIVNYMVLSLYDLTALRYVKRTFPYPKTLFISFLSYVFSYNVGLSVFGSSAIRLRFYSTWGMEAGTIAKIVTFCIATFWVGLAAIGGTTLLLGPAVQTAYPWFNASARVLGFILTGIAAAYLIACASGKASISFRRFQLSLPSGKLAVAQILVAALDWFFSAYTLYVLLPAGHPPFLRFLSVFIVAQLAAFTSHVPGGIGVLETVLVLSLSSYMPSGEIFGALLVYRGVFYLFPLAVAIIAFATRELWAGWKKATGLAKAAVPIIPAILAAAVFAAGAVLLFSAATPSVSQRLKFFGSIFPLFLLETSHFGASLVGLALLLIADGLRRRVDAAYYISVGLLTAGAVFSLLKAFEWEESLVLIAVLGLLIPSHKYFYRRAVLLTKPDAWWVLGVGMVLAASAWIGLFAYKHVQFSSELWWKFEFSRNSPRFLRAGLGVSICTAIVAIRLLLSHRPQLSNERLASCEGDVLRILESSPSANAYLALFGEKFFHFGAERKSFIMYAVTGRTCVVIGDPVGEKTEFEDMLWDFFERARQQGARIVWYGISSAELPIFVEYGLKVRKIGEEAIVDLTESESALKRAERLRNECAMMENAGYSFAVLSPPDVRRRLPELRAVFDQWLSSKKSKEKGFSIGFFSEAYLSRFNCAVVEKAGSIVAFASLWTSGEKKEASVDLFRGGTGAPEGTMEFLCARSIEWAQANGFLTFNLGTAPLSGEEEARLTVSFWNKAAPLLFQELRAFKSLFLPNWYPRYIVSSGGVSLGVSAADIAMLISKGNILNRRFA